MGHMTKARIPHHFGLDRQGVAVLAGGTLRPPSGSHQQELLIGVALQQTGTPMGSWQQTGTPMGSWAKAT